MSFCWAFIPKAVASAIRKTGTQRRIEFVITVFLRSSASWSLDTRQALAYSQKSSDEQNFSGSASSVRDGDAIAATLLDG